MKLKFVFYTEFLLSFYSIIVAAFAPSIFLQNITGFTEFDGVATELSRWYAVLLSFLMYVFMAALHQKQWAIFKHVILIMLVGDVLHVATTISMAANLTGWTTGLFFSLGVTLLFGTNRVLALVRPQWIGKEYI